MLVTALGLRLAHYASQVQVFTAMIARKVITQRVRVSEDEAAEHENDPSDR